MTELSGKEFHDVLNAKCIPALVKSNRRRAVLAARMRRYKVHAKIWLQNLKDRFK
jgi:hypothetical protein